MAERGDAYTGSSGAWWAELAGRDGVSCLRIFRHAGGVVVGIDWGP